MAEEEKNSIVRKATGESIEAGDMQRRRTNVCVIEIGIRSVGVWTEVVLIAVEDGRNGIHTLIHPI